jgi:hypothetical protein
MAEEIHARRGRRILSRPKVFHTLETKVCYQRAAANCGTVDRQTQAKALRLRMYVLCSECARLIDLAEGDRQQREVEPVDLLRHDAEEHAYWLEVLGIDEV